MNERRSRRSKILGEAARLYLEAVAERHGLDALILANEDGLLMAAASRTVRPLELDWIAALGTLCAMGGRRGPSLGALAERATDGRMLVSTEMVLRGERLYMTAVGGALPPMGGVGEALERILAGSLPAVA